jgi:hypothetical protein
VITVHYRYVSESNMSSTYSALRQIIDNPEKCWINGGKDNALKVQCSSVSIALNDFVAGDGSKVAAIRNEGGFCSIVSELGPENERNTFTADMLITKVTHVNADPEKNIPADFATVSGCVFGYGPVLLPVSFVIRNENGMQYFEGLDATNAQPVFTKVWGRVNSLTVKFSKTEESAFGEAAVQTYERKTKEYLITGTAKVPYDFGDEEVLTVADVNKLSQNRQVMLAEVEKRYNDRQMAKKANGGVNFGDAPKTAPAFNAIPTGGFKF